MRIEEALSALEQATSLDGLIVMGTILGTTNRSVIE